MTGNGKILRDVFEKNFESALEAASYGDEESFAMSVHRSRTGCVIVSDLIKPQAAQKKKKETDSDVLVEIPEGPFTVKNSGTGKDDLLSCHDGLLSLSEDGNELWSTAFDGSLCGRASCVDFFRNNKLQFLFCSGSSVCMTVSDALSRDSRSCSPRRSCSDRTYMISAKDANTT